MEQEIQLQPQPQQPNPLLPNNKNKINPALVFCVVAVVLIAGVGAYLFVNKSANKSLPFSTALSTQPTNLDTPLNTQNDFTPDVKNDVFIATTEAEGRVLNILIFNPVENKVIVSKKISLDAPLGPARTTSHGANDSVQYNPKTKEIFFFAEGYTDDDGSCIKNGKCLSRIYKISLDQIRPTILFESELNKHPTNWVVNSFDNSLLLSFSEGKIQSLKKINGQDGKLIFTKDYQIKDNTELTDFVLSTDGKYTYQASKESVDGKWLYEILRLRKIDNSNGDVAEQEIFGGESIIYGTNISPDNNYFAFYSGMQTTANPPSKLYIYEIATKKLINVPYQGSIGNHTLLWSGDSKKLLHQLENSLTYYDILSAKSTLIDGDLQQNPYAYAWAPSTNYFAYQSQNIGIKIFDVQKNQVIDTQTKTATIEVGGVSWY